MTLSRRKFVHLLSIATTACTALITPAISWAAWVNDAFNANETEEAYKKLFGSTSLKKTKKVKLKVPKVPDNNNAVPISVKTDIQNVDSISLFVENNLSLWSLFLKYRMAPYQKSPLAYASTKPLP